MEYLMMYIGLTVVILAVIVAAALITSINNLKTRHAKMLEAFNEFHDIMDQLDRCKTPFSIREVRDKYSLFMTKWASELTLKELDVYRTDFFKAINIKRDEIIN